MSGASSCRFLNFMEIVAVETVDAAKGRSVGKKYDILCSFDISTHNFSD